MSLSYRLELFKSLVHFFSRNYNFVSVFSEHWSPYIPRVQMTLNTKKFNLLCRCFEVYWRPPSIRPSITLTPDSHFSSAHNSFLSTEPCIDKRDNRAYQNDRSAHLIFSSLIITVLRDDTWHGRGLFLIFSFFKSYHLV